MKARLRTSRTTQVTAVTSEARNGREVYLVEITRGDTLDLANVTPPPLDVLPDEHRRALTGWAGGT